MKKEFKIGTYKKNQKGFGFVKLEDQEDEVHIAKENSLNALNGDTVSIEIIKSKEVDKKEEGKIIKIIRHEKDTVVGTFQKNRNFGFVVPDDKNFGTDIFISKANWGKARNGHKVLVQITKYPEKGKNAEGKIIEVLGGINEAGVDMLSLIKQYELPYKFPDEVVNEAKAFGTKIDEGDLQNRKDLRDDIVFTIDGEDAKDLDDARKIALSYQDEKEVCRLYAIGGDGFVHKVVNGMVGSFHELVVIPQGTGNDFARSIYKNLDAIKIFKESLNKQAKAIDVIQCKEDLYCINVFCCGLDADVGNLVNTNRKTTLFPRIMQYKSFI